MKYYITDNWFPRNSNMPKPVYDSIMVEFNKIQEMNPCISDYSILIQYLNFVVKLPWNISTKETLDLKKAKSVKNHELQ